MLYSPGLLAIDYSKRNNWFGPPCFSLIDSQTSNDPSHEAPFPFEGPYMKTTPA